MVSHRSVIGVASAVGLGGAVFSFATAADSSDAIELAEGVARASSIFRDFGWPGSLIVCVLLVAVFSPRIATAIEQVRGRRSQGESPDGVEHRADPEMRTGIEVLKTMLEAHDNESRDFWATQREAWTEQRKTNEKLWEKANDNAVKIAGKR